MSFLLDAYDVRSVFDVGACEGVLSHILATYRARPITVHAFEMNRDAYAQLEMKSVDPGVVPGRIIPHRAGMSDRHEGERAIWFSRTAMFEDEPHPSQYREALHRRLKFALRGQFNRDKLHKETVLLTTIDQMVRTHGAPQMIKIDVDGYEGKVLNGAGAVIKSHRPLILLELHKDELLARTGWTRARVADFVFDAGYRVAHIKNHNRDAAPDFVKVGRGDRVFDVQSTMHFLCY